MASTRSIARSQSLYRALLTLYPRSFREGYGEPMAQLFGDRLRDVGTSFEAHNWGGRIFGSGLLMAFGAAMLFGLMRRPLARQSGNSVILLATIPPLLFFWVIVPPLAAIVVWIGVISSGFSDQPV